MATIFALSSGSLPAAVALFRISGRQSLKVLKSLSGKDVWSPREMKYTVLRNQSGIIDRAMAVYLPGPNTFTGEDTTEIFVHGSIAVARELARTLNEFDDVREARRGEFTRRAFHNGKMDVNEVHGLGALLKATSETQRRLAFGKMRGGRRAVEIRDKLKQLTAKLFLLIDFGEHVDVELQDVRADIAEVINDVRKLLKGWKQAGKIERGLNIVLYGRPNTGKSSILNSLVRDDVAIVSDVPGTTRDSILTNIEISGVPCRLTDTAGIRSDDVDIIEMEGIERAKSRLKSADVVLLVIDQNTTPEEFEELRNDVKKSCEPETKVLVVKNKKDLGRSYKTDVDCVPCSTLEEEGTSQLLNSLEDVVHEMSPESTNLLDAGVLKEVLDHLTETEEINDAARICSKVEDAVDAIAELTSKVTTETVLDHIFESFCIGK